MKRPTAMKQKQSLPHKDETYKKCCFCGSQLSEDPNEIFMAISEDAMEAQGILDVSEINDNSQVFLILCYKCGFHEGCATVAELRAAAAEMERNEQKQ